ncbi:MAG TPA: EamA family transporter [Euzebyales bacterium]|nr:EamA family transporter [Euzebyales bacterium]
MSRRLVPLGLALVSAAAFGTAGPLAKPLITAGLGPLDVAWLRVVGAALVLAPATARHADAIRRWPAMVIGYGLLAVAGVQAAYFAAVARVPVGVALLVEYLAPVLVLLFVRFVVGRAVPRAAAAGAAVSLVGLVAVVQVWQGLRFDPLGLALALLAAVCLASYFVLSERGDAAEPGALLGWGLLVGALALTVVARPWEAAWSVLAGPVTFGSGEVPAMALAATLVLVATVVAYRTGIAAVRRLSAPVGAVVASLEVVVAAAMAWVLLGEAMSVAQVVGGVLVLVGAALAQRSAAPGEVMPGVTAIADHADRDTRGPRAGGTFAGR